LKLVFMLYRIRCHQSLCPQLKINQSIMLVEKYPRLHVNGQLVSRVFISTKKPRTSMRLKSKASRKARPCCDWQGIRHL
jgi:hypothetical protein